MKRGSVKVGLLIICKYAVSVALLLIGWGLLAAWGGLPKFILPSPLAVGQILYEERAFYMGAAGYTLRNMAIGGAAGIGLGFLTGVLLALSRTMRWIVEPYLIIFQSFPREALVPLFVVWMGFGAGPKAVTAAMLSYFPMAIVTCNSLLDTRRDYLELVRSWGATRWQEFRFCRLPSIVLSTVGAVKVCLPLALIGAVLGEFMGGNEGLGWIIITAGAVSRVDRLFGAVVVLGVVGTVLLGAVNAVQQYLLDRFNQE